MPFFLLLLPVIQTAVGATFGILAGADIVSVETRNLVFMVLGIPVPLQVAAVARSLKQTEEKTDTLLLGVEPIVEHAPVEPIVKEKVRLFASEIKAQKPQLRHPRKSPREIR